MTEEDPTQDHPELSGDDADASVEDLDDGHAPPPSPADVVDGLEERVLEERDNPLLDVERDADAAAVETDPEHTGDEVQPPV